MAAAEGFRPLLEWRTILHSNQVAILQIFFKLSQIFGAPGNLFLSFKVSGRTQLENVVVVGGKYCLHLLETMR